QAGMKVGQKTRNICGIAHRNDDVHSAGAGEFFSGFTVPQSTTCRSALDTSNGFEFRQDFAQRTQSTSAFFNAAFDGIRHLLDVDIEKSEGRLALLEDEIFLGASDDRGVAFVLELVSDNDLGTIQHSVLEAAECISFACGDVVSEVRQLLRAGD